MLHPPEDDAAVGAAEAEGIGNDDSWLCRRAWLGTTSTPSKCGVRDMVHRGEDDPPRIPSMAKAASIAAAPPRVWPICDLLDDTGMLSRRLPKTSFRHSTSVAVALRRGGAVGVHVLYVAGREAGVLDGLLHADG